MKKSCGLFWMKERIGSADFEFGIGLGCLVAYNL